MISAHRLGRYAEDLAAKYLVSIGWKILARNVWNQYGELDIVSSDTKAEELVIAEVRCRTKNKVQDAIDSVNARKLRTLLRASSEYVETIGYAGFWRIDLIAVTIDTRGSLEDWTLEHVKDITDGMSV
ncbi:MAG: YraN family protein [Synergistaceae bacterium]|nr:YraN family protein [Synergistaceae bacterium]